MDGILDTKSMVILGVVLIVGSVRALPTSTFVQHVLDEAQ
jgi:hypothetical protein